MSLSRYSRPTDANLCRAVVDSVVDVVIMVHDMANEARVIYANEAACQHFGVDLETLLTWTPARWDPCHDPDLAISMALADGRPRSYETEHLVALGDKIPVEVTLNRLDLPGCNYLLSSIRDLRPRQLREPCADWLERRALEMCLERSDKTIYDNLLDSLFLFDVDADGELIVAGYNRRAEGLIGLREAESIGRRKQDVLPSVTLMGAESPERACVANAAPVCFRDTLGLPDGRRQVENTLIPLFDAEDRVQRVIYIVHDITQRLRRESQEVVRTEVFDLLSAGADLREVLARVVVFAEISRPDLLSAILLPDAERICLESCIAPSLPEVFVQAVEGGAISESADVFGRSAYLKMPETVANLLDHYLDSACHVLALASGLVSCWVTPILDSSDELLGIFAFFRDRAGQPDAQDQATMDQACQMARLVMERRRTEAHIRYQANYDALTGLPNRTLLNVRLADRLRKSKQLALLYIDIDNFKEINDTLGHHQGDQMLELVARRLRFLVSEEDLVARMSGDEFIAVLSNVTHAESTAEALRTALAGDYEIGHSNVWASVSIGIALYPEQARDMDELLSYADQALFAAKAAGRNCLRIFDEAMREKIQLRVRLASDLRTALKAEQLSVHYQPIIDMVSGRVIKAEALLRWEHPELGQVSPEVFIPIAEETGAIHEIGNWVFREAARVAMQWNHQAWTGDCVLRRISVNRSPRQFFTREGCDDWLAHLHNQGIPGEALGVEITEGLLLDDRPDVMRQLTAFRSAGIAISLDDFGTGYSALSYLKKFDIDYLKIDRSFVQDIVSMEGSRAIVESIASMAVRLGMQVIAEGVEEPAQAEVLAAIGCRLAQGYLYARPMPEQAFMAFAAAEIETPTLR
ncbi:EAL domain-containing protein [Nitrincola sp.]|uniref:sensor domain-containing protein n=1 Tax=Nitrincola sp. TaxID=1926584 RepID=UPI003A93CCA1